MIVFLFWLIPLFSVCAADSGFNDGWKFHLEDVSGAEGENFNDAAWEVVSLPHPAKIEARVCGKENNPQWEGICWYRKVLTITSEEAGKVVWVRFEGAMNKAILYANGKQIAENLDGYLPFVADLSPLAKTLGKITLALKLDNQHNPVTGPATLTGLDFNLYHGLYRPASLIIKPLLHITDEILENKPASGGVFVTYPEVSEKTAVINTQTHLRNRAETSASFSLHVRLSDLSGREVARKESVGLNLSPGEDKAFTVPITVNEPRLWSPQQPNLHDLDVDVVAEGKVIDHQRTRIGIRRIQVSSGGLMINGQKLFLRGANRHQEYPYIGNALPDAAQFRDAFKIKQSGLDYIRLSHYPQSPAFMDACDELGIITMDAILGWHYNSGKEEFYANRVQSVRELVRRDRNHPCAALWEASLNETGMRTEFVKRLNDAAHEEYPGDQMITVGWVNGYDVKGTSRQSGSTKEFTGATFPCIVMEGGDWEYMSLKQELGFTPESSKIPRPRSIYGNSRQARGGGEIGLLIQMLNFQQAHNENLRTNAMGDGIWSMFDYNRGYSKNYASCGISDLFRLPKFSFYFFQSQRDPGETWKAGNDKIGGPMIFIASDWTSESIRPVRVLSNAEEVELFLNGKSLGRQKPGQDAISDQLRHPPFLFQIPQYEAGELWAVGYINGKAVAEHRVRTPGTPKSIAVSVDSSGKPARAGGDVVFLYAKILDESGTVVPNNKLPVTFTVEGDAVLVGENPINSEAGIASILLKTGPKPGTVRIKAQSGELWGATMLPTE